VKAACSPTYYGQVISVPSTDTIGDSESISSTSSTIGVGPSGFLVEDAGAEAADPTTGLTYENILGAGYGAIGLPQPSSDITPALLAAQFQGFLYSPDAPKFSLISSFAGSSDTSSACAIFVGQLNTANLTPSPNTIYGGDYELTATTGTTTVTTNDPNGTVNCDIAIDLGTQDPKNNGLYPVVNVYIDNTFPDFPTSVAGNVYFFSAVAVAGQFQGKNAIFLIGADAEGTGGPPKRAWGIYLLQPNLQSN
jgi:hypothetical protein